MDTERSTLVFFFSTGDAVLFKSREITGRNQTLSRWLGGRRGKDDRKQNTLAQLGYDNQGDLEIGQVPVLMGTYVSLCKGFSPH
jgi:hypothetical protein